MAALPQRMRQPARRFGIIQEDNGGSMVVVAGLAGPAAPGGVLAGCPGHRAVAPVHAL